MNELDHEDLHFVLSHPEAVAREMTKAREQLDAALARAEAAEREIAEVGVRGSPPPEGSYIQRLEARAEEAETEVARLKAGGCARDQRLTQYCAEAVKWQQRAEAARRELEAVLDTDAGRAWLHARGMAKTADRERVRAETAERELEAERQKRRQALEDIEARDVSVERAMAEVAQLREAARELAQAEADYRVTHDAYGGSNIRSGRAWDRMQRAGDRMRAALAAKETAR